MAIWEWTAFEYLELAGRKEKRPSFPKGTFEQQEAYLNGWKWTLENGPESVTKEEVKDYFDSIFKKKKNV